MHPALVASAAVVLAALVSCGESGPVTTASGVVVVVGEPRDGALDALLEGELSDVGGCLGVESDDQRMVVIWPDGSEALDGPDGQPGVRFEGEDFFLGDPVSVSGGAPGAAPGVGVPAGCGGDRVWIAN